MADNDLINMYFAISGEKLESKSFVGGEDIIRYI